MKFYMGFYRESYFILLIFLSLLKLKNIISNYILNLNSYLILILIFIKLENFLLFFLN